MTGPAKHARPPLFLPSFLLCLFGSIGCLPTPLCTHRLRLVLVVLLGGGVGGLVLLQCGAGKVSKLVKPGRSGQHGWGGEPFSLASLFTLPA